jgi:Tfp pilus assembly protein PilN
MSNRFNFARRPFVNERLPRLVFVVAATLVIGLTLVHGFFLARYLVREQEELDVQVAELRDELARTNSRIASAAASVAQGQTELSNDKTLFLAHLYRLKSFSWTGLFNELEEITPRAVRITSIAPVEIDGEISVTLTLVGRTLQNVLEMVSALEGSSFFATVFPLDDVDLAERDAGSGIAATLQLRYVDFEPRTPEPEPEPKSEPEPDLENATMRDDAAPPELDVIEDDPRPKAEREP